MAALVKGKKDYLVIQFRYKGMLCREYTGRIDSRDNRRSLAAKVRAITRELNDGSFDYAARFPKSPALKRLGLVIEKPTGTLTLGRQARIWLKDQELGTSSKRDYEYLFRTFLDRTALGAMLLDAVTVSDIREVIQASTSVRRTTMFLQRLRSIYAGAIEDELVGKNPAARVQNPKLRVRRQPVDPFVNDVERLTIYNAAQGVDRGIVALVMGNGLRLGEAFGLRRQDVDFHARKIEITGAVYRGKEKDTKNARSTRVIDLIDDVLPVAAALQGFTDRIGPLFPNARGGYIDLANWRERNWRMLLGRAGMEYREPNVLRHSFAVAMLQARFDPVYIGNLMGHFGAEMVLRRYARWSIQRRSAIRPTPEF